MKSLRLEVPSACCPRPELSSNSTIFLCLVTKLFTSCDMRTVARFFSGQYGRFVFFFLLFFYLGHWNCRHWQGYCRLVGPSRVSSLFIYAFVCVYLWFCVLVCFRECVCVCYRVWVCASMCVFARAWVGVWSLACACALERARACVCVCVCVWVCFYLCLLFSSVFFSVLVALQSTGLMFLMFGCDMATSVR